MKKKICKIIVQQFGKYWIKADDIDKIVGGPHMADMYECEYIDKGYDIIRIN
jgi:hypothetical protein